MRQRNTPKANKCQRPGQARPARRPLVVVLLLAALALPSCMRSAPEPPTATTREYLVVQRLKYDDIWLAAVRSMTKNLNVKHLDQAEGVIKGRLTEWGFTEYVQVSIKPPQAGAASYRLEVLSTRHRSVVMRDWAAFIMEDLRKTIERVPGHKTGDVKVISEPL